MVITLGLSCRTGKPKILQKDYQNLLARNYYDKAKMAQKVHEDIKYFHYMAIAAESSEDSSLTQSIVQDLNSELNKFYHTL